MLNTKTLITIKTDKILKKAAQETAEEIGVPLGTLINSFLKQFVRTKEVSFSAEYRPTALLIKAIRDAEAEYSTSNGAGDTKPKKIKEFMKDLTS